MAESISYPFPGSESYDRIDSGISASSEKLHCMHPIEAKCSGPTTKCSQTKKLLDSFSRIKNSSSSRVEFPLVCIVVLHIVVLPRLYPKSRNALPLREQISTGGGSRS